MTDRKRNFLLLLLSFAAGGVDAIAFVHTGAFPANMTGNSVVLGLALARTNIDHASLSVLALAGFCLGVVIAGWFTTSFQGEKGWTRRISAIFLGAGIILLTCVGMLEFLGERWFAFLIGPTAVAMGMQSAAVLKLGVSGVSTTVITGTLATGLLRLTGRLRKAGENRSTPGEKPWLPLLSWMAYLAGAFAGGIQSVWDLNWLLALPGLLLVGIAILGGLVRRVS